MGILDNKSRVLDTSITLEGRRQLTSGKLKISYVTFSDATTFYQADAISGSSDASARIYLETNNLPQDQITFRADSSGLLQPFLNEMTEVIKNGQIISYSSSSLAPSQTVFGADLETTSETLLASSLENFAKLYAIGTHDVLFEQDDFIAGPKNIQFVITDERPISDKALQVANVNHLESFFNDQRLSRLPNFQYLPPINKIADQTVDRSNLKNVSRNRLGRYAPWGSTTPLTFEQLKHELDFYEKNGLSKVVTFDPTSKKNTLIAQVFEVNHDVMRKLDLIDFGNFQTGNVTFPNAHVYFAGKILIDENGSETFIHMFTMMFQ